MKKFFAYLGSRPLGMGSFLVILVLYLLMAFAEFIAPYSPTTSFPDKTYHPPNLRFTPGPAAQEARVTNTVSWKYVRIKGLYHPVRFFARGEPYKLFGLIPASRHLFTTGAIPASPSPEAAMDGGGTMPAAGGGEPFRGSVGGNGMDAVSAYPVFLMGADNLGRDLFSRIIYGSRISLTIGFIATAISLALAVFFGGLSGYSGGAADWGIMRFAEFFMLIPGLYLILFLRSLLGTGMDSGQTYITITIILSLVGWPGSARTIRGMVHAIKREDFVQNARLEMVPAPVIITAHIIPQIASLLIVSVALSVPGFIMTETTLSYLGLGITEPAVSWGSLIKRDITTVANLKAYPWLLQPVWFLLAVTLAFNFFGDTLRDFFDPYHTIFARPQKSAKKRRAEGLSPGIRPVSANGKEAAGDNPVRESAPLLEVRDLRVSFTVSRGSEAAASGAVRGVSFTLSRGETLGIVGESGSGKTVTTQAIPGLLPANAAAAGSVLYEGAELLGADTAALREYRGKKIGMIFQEPGRSYDPLQSMEKVFLETLRNSRPGITREAAREKARALLAEVGMEGSRLSGFPHQFSGGQLQRIGIALALAQGCELLIADEPTTALDVTVQKQIIELLASLQKSRNLSIIFISHDIELVAGLSSRLCVMYGGLVMESGPAADIMASPRHPYTQALLAASPVLGRHYSAGALAVIPGKVSDPVLAGMEASPNYGPQHSVGRDAAGCPFAPRCARALPECAAALPPLTANGARELRCPVETVHSHYK